MSSITDSVVSMPAFEKITNSDGSVNTNYVDLLDVDKPIAGQKFACMSFVSPEKILKMRELFYFEEFLKQWKFSKSFECFTSFLNFISFKYSLKFEDLNKDLIDFCENEKETLLLSRVDDDYKQYIETHDKELDKAFNFEHKFKTNTRGVKVRGCFPTQEEAEMRCKLLREMDPNHDVFLGEVGIWLPFHPEAYKTGRVEYLEEELNQLMHEKRKNETNATMEFDKRVLETKKKAMEDNIKKAKASGNVLTQTINEDGNLVNVKDINVADKQSNKSVDIDELRRELFEGDNIVMDRR